MDHPTVGAGLKRADRVDFDPRVRLEFKGTQLSSDGGLLVMRELDDALGLSQLAPGELRDSRTGKNTVGSTGRFGKRLTDDWWAMRMSKMPAYNLATFLRCIELPEAMADWSLTSLQLKLIKIGARVVRRARAITFQLAGGDRLDGARHPCRDPTLASAAVMRVTATQTQTERKRQDRSVRRAKKQGRQARMMRSRGLIRPTPGVSATATPLGRKTLAQRVDYGNFAIKRHATWGMSVDQARTASAAGPSVAGACAGGLWRT